MKNPILLPLAIFLISIPFAQANDNKPEFPDAYFRAGEVTIREVVPTAQEIASGYLDSSSAPSVLNSSEPLATLDFSQIVLIGEKIIELIKRGAPVVNIKRDSVAAVPNGLEDWRLLGGWQAPVTKAYEFSIKNLWGANVVDVRLKVSGMWGGNLDGRGQYLANVQVVPVSVRVLWGWSLDLWSENRDPVNTGTTQAPVAGLGFDIRYKAYTSLNEFNGSKDYFITGDGKINEVQ